MMKNIQKAFLGVLIMGCISCENDEEVLQAKSSTEDFNSEILSKAEIDEVILNKLMTNGKFEWNMVDDQVLISALVHSDSLASIGYNEAVTSGKVNYEAYRKNSKSFKDTKSKIKEIFTSKSSSNRSSSTTVQSGNFVYEDTNYPIIDAKIFNQETLDEVRAVGNIRYIEPINYKYNEKTNVIRSKSSGSGCGDLPAETLNPADYTRITPNALQGWNYDYMNIPQAWNYSTGKNITIGVIDSGVFEEQAMLNENFTISNPNRRVENFGTYVDSWWIWSTETDGVWDKCGHGTQMSGIATAPRSDKGTPVGVAYDSNLIAIRGTSDVLLDDYHEQKGVAEAFTILANRPDVKIISMSVGHAISIGRIKDAVKYAYSKGKIIVAAGGTSTTFTTWYGVIFPAWMPETVAVTGVTDASDYESCDICHEGSEIDFTVVMQRSGNGSRNALSLTRNDFGASYISGSSAATATFAGVSALVWSKYPNESRAQILDRLKKAGDFYPNRDNEYGWGTIDALKAVQ